MRWSSILLPFSLLGAGVLAAKSPANTFQDFHQKALSSTPIKLDDASYKKVTGLPRDYTVAVLLTALDSRYACQMCRDFDPEWRLLSKSWAKGDKAGDSKTLFTVLDFNDGRETFMSVCAQCRRPLSFPPRPRTFSNYLSTTSSDSKPPLFSCSSSPRLESSPLPTPTLFDLTSPLGEYSLPAR